MPFIPRKKQFLHVIAGASLQYFLHDTQGVRQILYHTASQLLHTDFCASEETADTLSNIASVLDLFDSSANTEDWFILPTLEHAGASITATVLTEVKNSAPAFVFKNLLQLAESALPGNRWRIVQNRILEDALLA